MLHDFSCSAHFEYTRCQKSQKSLIEWLLLVEWMALQWKLLKLANLQPPKLLPFNIVGYGHPPVLTVIPYSCWCHVPQRVGLSNPMIYWLYIQCRPKSYQWYTLTDAWELISPHRFVSLDRALLHSELAQQHVACGCMALLGRDDGCDNWRISMAHACLWRRGCRLHSAALIIALLASHFDHVAFICHTCFGWPIWRTRLRQRMLLFHPWLWWRSAWKGTCNLPLHECHCTCVCPNQIWLA